MPTFSAIAFGRFIEPAGRDPGTKPLGLDKNIGPSKGGKSFRPLISPALLCSAPHNTPTTGSPTSFNPSRYVLNHKWRVPLAMVNGSEVVGFDLRAAGKESERKEGIEEEKWKSEGGTVTDSERGQFVGKTSSGEDSALVRFSNFGVIVAASGKEADCESGAENSIRANDIMRCTSPGPKEEKESECDDFFEAEDWRSAASSSDTEDVSTRSRSGSNYAALANRSEFFDALDDLSPEDVASQTSESNNLRMQDELDGLRSMLSIEIEKRKRMEEALSIRQTQWQEIAKKFSTVGLSFPSIDAASRAEQDRESVSVDQLCKQFAVARLVAESVGRGSARAELEQEMEAMIDGKNREIARLRDKLQYHEVINQEMSHRKNQEAIEIARRRRQGRKRKHRWMWTSLAMAVSIGAATLVYCYFPQTDMKGWRSPFDVQTVSEGTEAEHRNVI